MKQPLISIITPSYNNGRFIRECIESVLAQDYPNIEHIIQDGASTDGTLKVLKRYNNLKLKKRIKWLSTPDTGQIDALNRSLKRARGDIILVLNADDALMPYACSWGAEQMAKYKDAAVVYGDQYLIDEKGATIGVGVTGPFDFVKFLCIEQYMATQAVFIRRSCFEKVGMWVDPTLETMPDYELWLRIASQYPMQHVAKVVTKYRIYPHWDGKHPRSASRFIKAKSQVLERWLADPSRPYLKTLRNRAYAGMYLWVAEEMLNLGNYKDYLVYSVLALLTYPKRSTVTRIQTVFYEKLWRKWRKQKNH